MLENDNGPSTSGIQECSEGNGTPGNGARDIPQESHADRGPRARVRQSPRIRSGPASEPTPEQYALIRENLILQIREVRSRTDMNVGEISQRIPQMSNLALEVAEAFAGKKQQNFQATFLKQQHFTYVALGGNRSGKSIVCGALCMARWLRDYARNEDEYWCIAPGEKTVGQQKVLWDFLPRYMFGENKWEPKFGFGRERPTVTLHLPHGRGHAVVRFKTCDQDPSTFEQGKLAGWWADEFLPRVIYDRLIPRTLDLSGWGLYSDIPEQDWHTTDLINATGTKIYCIQFGMIDNAHILPPGTIERALEQMTEEEAAMRVYGKPRQLSAVVYRQFKKNIHVIPSFPIPEDWPIFMGLDYGFSAPTACLWFVISPEEIIYVIREYYVAGGSIQGHAKAILAMCGNERYKRRYVDPHAFDRDPRQRVSVRDEYALCGLPMQKWPFVQKMGEHAMVEKVKRRLENQTLFVFDTCLETIREFAAWKHKTDREGNPSGADMYEKKNNHALDVIKGVIGCNPCYSMREVKAISAFGDDDDNE